MLWSGKGTHVHAVARDWFVSAHFTVKTVASRPAVTKAFRAFMEWLMPRHREAGISCNPDEWSGLMTGLSAEWKGLTREESLKLSVALRALPCLVVVVAREVGK